jgi:hypothetical protein
MRLPLARRTATGLSEHGGEVHLSPSKDASRLPAWPSCAPAALLSTVAARAVGSVCVPGAGVSGVLATPVA